MPDLNGPPAGGAPSSVVAGLNLTPADPTSPSGTSPSTDQSNASPLAQPDPVQADATATVPVDHRRTIGPNNNPDINPKEEVKQLAMDVGAAGVDAANLATNSVTSIGNAVNKLGNKVRGDNAVAPFENPLHMDANDIVGEPENDVHKGIRTIAAFAAVMTGVGLTEGAAAPAAAEELGSTTLGGNLAKAGQEIVQKRIPSLLNAAGIATLGADETVHDFMTQTAPSIPKVGPATGSLINMDPTNPLGSAIAQRYLHNIMSFATMEVLIAGGLGVAAMKFGVKPADVAIPKLPEDVATIRPENGTFHVEPKVEPTPAPVEGEAAPPKVLKKVSTEKDTNGMDTHTYTASINGKDYPLQVTPSEDGKFLHVPWVGREGAPKMEGFESNAVEKPVSGANEVGPKQIRSVMKELAAEYPDAEYVTGKRVSGARFGEAGAGKATAGEFDLRRYREQKPVSFDNHADAEVEVAARNEQSTQLNIADETTGAPKLTDEHKQMLDQIVDVMKRGGNQQEINRIVANTDAPWPYYLQPDHLKGFMSDMADVLKRGRGELAKPDAVRNAEAAKLAVPEEDPNGVMNRYGSWFGDLKDMDVKIKATQIYLQGVGQTVNKLSESFQAAPKSATAGENLQQAWTTLMHVYSNLRATGTELGRGLRAMKPEQADNADATGLSQKFGAAPEATPLADPTEKALSPEQDLTKLKPADLKAFARRIRASDGDPTDVLEAVHEQLMTKNFEQTETNEAAREARFPKPTTAMDKVKREGRILKTFLINNMISGPGTAIRVAASQAIMTAKLDAEYFLGGINQMALGSKADGLETLHRGWDLVTGQLTSVGDAFTAAGRALRTGDSHIDPRAPFMPEGGLKPATYELGDYQWMNTAISMWSRVHTTETEFSKVMNYRAMVRMQSLAQSRAEGLGPARAGQALADDMRIAFDPNGKGVMNADAMYEARRATFTLPLQDGTVGRTIEKGLADHPVLKLLVAPFQRVSTNILRESWKMMPGLNMLQKTYREDLAAGGERQARATANMQMGGMALGALLYKAAKGEMQGRFSSDPTLRQQQKDAGLQEYSVKLGGSWYSMANYEPLGMLATSASDVHDVGSATKQRLDAADRFRQEGQPKQQPIDFTGHPVLASMRMASDLYQATKGTMSEDGMPAVWAMAAHLSSQFASKTFMGPMVKALEIFTDDDRGGTRYQQWLQEQAATMVPGSKFWQHINTDPTQREAHGLIEGVMQKVPGLSTQLEAHRTYLGEKSEIPPGFLDWANNHINPFLTTKGVTDPVNQELLRLGKKMPMPAKSVKAGDGLAALDLTDRGKWDQDGGKQSPYDRMLELMSQPIYSVDGKMSNARQAVTSLIKSDGYQSSPYATTLEPGGERYDMVAGTLKDIQKTAMDKMMNEPRYANLKTAIAGAKAVNKLTPTGRDSLVHAVHHQIMTGSVDSLLDLPQPAR